MGQAKCRGTFEQRLASALERDKRLKDLNQPDLIKHVRRRYGRNHLVEAAILAALGEPKNNVP